MAEVTWTPQALEDLESVALFIARDSPAMGALFMERAFEAVDRIGDFPESGRIVPEFGRSDLREILLYSYRIIYRLLENRAEIITVHHGARLLRENRHGSRTGFPNE